jgi:hypothetical protein
MVIEHVFLFMINHIIDFQLHRVGYHTRTKNITNVNIP